MKIYIFKDKVIEKIIQKSIKIQLILIIIYKINQKLRNIKIKNFQINKNSFYNNVTIKKKINLSKFQLK